MYTLPRYRIADDGDGDVLVIVMVMAIVIWCEAFIQPRKKP